jgi:3-oxoacyl-[acyl-carrier protein] reductase
MSASGFTIDLTGKRALVTGAGQHTGRQIALGLAAAGATVFVNDVVHAKADAVCDEIRAAGGEASPLVFDITDLDATNAAIGGARPDIVVNNVGGVDAIPYPFVHFGLTDPTKWKKLIDLNFYGVLNTTYAALAHMTEQKWGRFITIMSDAGRRGERGQAVYGAAKAAGAGFMRGIATEYGFVGITANAISFGSIQYEHRDPPPPETLKKVLSVYSVKRPGRPTDPVGLLVLLASDHAEWITGQVIPVDGGFVSAL